MFQATFQGKRWDHEVASTPKWQMSALGQNQTSRHVRIMSLIPLKADIHSAVRTSA